MTDPMGRCTIAENHPSRSAKLADLLRFSTLSAAGFLRGRRWGPAHDEWLRQWIPLLRERVGDGVVVELGCGNGADLAMLAAEGFQVIGIDRSQSAIAAAGKRTSPRSLYCQDLREQFPPAAQNARGFIASLSLHYFSAAQTREVMGSIRECLAPGGIFLCRVNSTRDAHFGAVGHSSVEKNLYLVHGQLKRFFDEAEVLSLFREGWEVYSVQEMEIQRYALPKIVWEVVARRIAHSGTAWWNG